MYWHEVNVPLLLDAKPPLLLRFKVTSGVSRTSSWSGSCIKSHHYSCLQGAVFSVISFCSPSVIKHLSDIFILHILQQSLFTAAVNSLSISLYLLSFLYTTYIYINKWVPTIVCLSWGLGTVMRRVILLEMKF